MTLSEARSVCPHDCPDTCGLIARLEDGRVVSVRGDKEHPFTRGSLCAKVLHYPKRLYSPQRVLHPLRRSGPKDSGQFQQITWDQALDEIKERYQSVIETHGAQAILPYSYAGTMGLVNFNGGHAFFHKLGASKLIRTICSAAAQAGYAASLGTGPSTDIESIVDSDLILIWGSNTLATNIHAWPFFQKARKNGARIVVIDPYRNQTAARADWHLKLLPGTDAALALGVMHVLIAEDLLDHDFIARRTVGFKALKERATEYPPDRAAEITGLPPEDIKKLALWFGQAKAPYIRTGWGPARQIRGGMAMRTIALLPALAGALEKPGGGITRATTPKTWFNMQAILREDLAPQGARSINMIQLGRALTRLDSPPLKAIHVYHSNPAVVAPESEQVRAGLAREDLFCVVQEHFMTETALMADLVLPGAMMLETTDLYTGYGHYYIQMHQPVIQPLGQARSTLDIFQDLAARFGFSEPIFSMSTEQIIEELLPADHPAFKGITYDSLAVGKALRLKVEPYAGDFETPSGKVEFYSESLKKQGHDPLPDGTPSRDQQGQGRYPLQLITPPRLEFLNSTFNDVEELRTKAGPPTIMIHPQDAASRALQDGQEVRVFNDRGGITLFCRITDAVRPGVTVIEGIYWPRHMPGGKGVNTLTSQEPTDLGQSAGLHCNLVEVAAI
jgi:anaerobic selenocysteine-containing dehydrogenase